MECPEDIVEPETGWLINPGDVEELTAALEHAYFNYHEIKRKNHISGIMR